MAEKARQPELAKACAEAVQKTYGDKRITTSLNAEKQEAKYLREGLAESKQNKILQKDMDLIKRDLGKVQDGIDIAVSVYGPTPKERADLRDKKVYSREQFCLLKPVELAGAQVGGKPVTEREFAALALFAGGDPKIGTEAQKVAGDPEPAIEAFMADGYTREESEEIVTESGREMYGRSLMDRRENTGNYFAGAVQPAREKAQQALERPIIGATRVPWPISWPAWWGTLAGRRPAALA